MIERYRHNCRYKSIALVFIGFALLLLFSASRVDAVAQYDKGLSSLAESVKKATVRVDVFTHNGRMKSANGFFVSPEGHIVTTRHVTDGAASIMVVSSSHEKPFSAMVILNHPSAHLSLLQIHEGDKLNHGGKAVLKQPYLSISHGAFPLWADNKKKAQIVTVSLALSGFKAQATLRKTTGFSDPWVDSGLYRLSSQRDQLAKGITTGQKRVDDLSMVAYKTDNIPLTETGGPAFTLEGKLLGIVSFQYPA